MNSLIKYTWSLLAAFALLSSSCQQSDASLSADASEGVLSMDCSFVATRSGDISSDILDQSTLRIYDSEDNLVRWWRPATSVNEAGDIYMVAGEYRAEVTAGEIYDKTFDSEQLYYSAEQSFTITAQQRSSVSLTAKAENVAVAVSFDESIARNFDLGYGFYYAVVNSFSSADSASDELTGVTSVEFTEDGEVYFHLPEGVENISWWFYGQSSDSDIADGGKLSQVGAIEGVERATKYSLSLKYSPSADGFLDLNLTIDDSADVTDTTISFSPRPTITGVGGLSLQSVYPYASTSPSSESFTIAGLNNISEVSVELPSGEVLTPFADVAQVAQSGVSYSATDSKTGVLTIDTSLFDEYTLGGERVLTISATDIKGSQGSVDWTICTQGFGFDTNDLVVDYWLSTASFDFSLTEAYSSVEFKLRRDGGDWEPLSMSQSGDYSYVVNIEPQWVDVPYAGPLKGGLTTSKLDWALSAASSYEYGVFVDGGSEPLLGGSFAADAADCVEIPYGNLNNSSLTCWSNEASASSTSWASGNNDNASTMCVQGDSDYAILTSSMAGLLGIYKLASGNIFLGQFDMGSTTGDANFGQSFTWEARPQAFKFRYRASIGTIADSGTTLPSTAYIGVGSQDNAVVRLMIVDWSSRHTVTSGLGSPSGVFDPETATSVSEGNIIGYAAHYITESSFSSGTISASDFIEVEIPILYHDKLTKPSKSYGIVVLASNSVYGDYLTGCSSNVMHIDDFELVY